MRERSRLSSGNMLLLELIFAIIFFSLTLAVTLSVFGDAYGMSKKAEAREIAVSEVNDVAEIIRSAESVSEIDELLAMKGMSKGDDGGYYMDYGNYKYGMSVTTRLEGRLYTADIRCYETVDIDVGDAEEQPVYELTVEHALRGASDGR